MIILIFKFQFKSFTKKQKSTSTLIFVSFNNYNDNLFFIIYFYLYVEPAQNISNLY